MKLALIFVFQHACDTFSGYAEASNQVNLQIKGSVGQLPVEQADR